MVTAINNYFVFFQGAKLGGHITRDYKSTGPTDDDWYFVDSRIKTCFIIHVNQIDFK